MSELLEHSGRAAAAQTGASAPTSGGASTDPDQYWRERICEAFRVPPSPRGLPEQAAPTLRLGGLLYRCILARFEQLGSASLQPTESKALLEAVDGYATRKLELWLTKLTVYEINLAREQGRLCGETSQSRLASFFALVEDDDSALEIYLRYPVLIGRILRHFELLQDYLESLAARLVADRDALSALFGIDGALTGAELGRGDAHLGARQVVVLSFERGRVLFKPRSLHIDRLYADLVGHVQAALVYRLRTPAVLAHEDCGWQEFVESKPTPAPAWSDAGVDFATGLQERKAADCFYYSMGAHLALMHFANVSDVHFDNMLVTLRGEPVFFDLETAFANSYPPGHEVVRGVHHDALRQQLEQIARSVLKCGVLPTHAKASAGMNALTEIDERETLSTIDTLVDQDSDQVRVSRQLATIEVRSWLPVVDGRRTRPSEHVDQILLGFEHAYRAVLSQREALHQLVKQSAAHSVRSVVRNTSMYGMFLMESTHPVYAASAQRLQGLFSKLGIATEFQPAFRNVLADEFAQLMQFDIPAFHARLDSACLRGFQTRDMEFYGRSPLQAFEANLEALSAKDCAFQLGWIRRMLGRSSYPGAGATHDGLRFVRSIAAFLLENSERAGGDGSISWLQITLPEEGGDVLPLAPTLYSGLAGMLVAFSAFALEFGEPAFEDARHRLRRMLRADAERMIAASENPSLFQGCAGLLYALLQDARVHHDSEQIEFVRRQTLALELETLTANAHDVIAGRAGVMLFLSSLLEFVDDPAIELMLGELGDRLLSTRSAEAYAWSSEHGDCLGGFSHGNSGIAHALLRAGERLGREDFIAAGMAALAFEDSRFDAENANWPDLRKQTGAVFNASWCNGAVGYLLSRSAHLARLSQHGRTCFTLALQALLQQTDAGDESLCHGNAGVLDLLVQVRMQHPGLLSEREVETAMQRVLVSMPARSGSRDCDAPGLMTGLAGIAYGVLRRYRPQLPCVLSVQA
jgi:type 2 lantibiotic biosynthesis protein LanM